jgi:hypothetical protein
MVNIIHSRNLPKEHVVYPGTSKLAGFFKIEAIRPDGRRRLVADWQPNLITNAGLDGIGWGNKGGYIGQEYRWIYWCRLGTGNTEPQYTDTALATHRAEAARISATNGTVEVVPNSLYYRWQKIVYRFAQGAASGLISEIGTGMRLGYGSLSTRALIRDTGGTPTQIAIAVDEQVDVTYEFRTYIDDITPVDSQALINGVLYDLKAMPCEVMNTSNMNGTFDLGGGFGSIYGYKGYSTMPNIGTHLTAPSDNFGNGTGVRSTYVGGTYYQDSTLTLPYTDWYWGVKGVTAFSPRGFLQRFQMSFTQNLDPTMGIPHDNTNELIISFRHSWARFTPPA